MILRIIHNLFFYFLTVVSFFVATGITICFFPFARNKTRYYQATARIWFKFLAIFSGVKVSVKGLENIPSHQGVVFVANHQSAADIPILILNLPIYFRFAIKKELFKIPIFGWHLRRQGHFLIDREATLSTYKTIKDIVQTLKSGESVLIFPEGTRSRDGKLGKFKKGSLLVALKSGAPIIPIAISGSFEIMPRGTWLIKPSRVKLTIGKPIYIKSEEEYDRKAEEIRSTILKML